MTERLDLPRRYRDQIEALLRDHVPDVEVWAYGSRVNGRSHEGSDLDLVLRGPDLQQIDSGQLMDLIEALEESNVPIIVQTHDWARLPERFHREIEREYVVLVEKEGWKIVTLGDYIVANDAAYSSKEAWRQINYLDTGSITENRISEIQNLTVGKDKIPSRARRKIQPGDMVYSTVRPNQRHYGLLKELPENLLVSTGFAVIRGKKGLARTDFIYWYLAQDHIVDQLHTIAEHSTSAYPSIRPSDIEELKLYLPPLSEQRAIAHILGTLDDKIELNRRMNETLEGMARALFKSWFVDFDPVRAKMEGRDTGLPPDVAALFPDRLVESELGEIPEGWEVKTVGTITSIVGGTTPSTKQAQYWKGGTHCWATPKDLASLSVPVLLKTERKITDAGLGKIGSGLLPPGSVLLSSRAPIGYLAVAETPVAINQGFIGIMPHEGISNLFMLYWSEASHDEILNHANGSTFLEISKGNFRQLPVVVPDESAMKKFDGLARTLYNRIVSNERQSHSLAAMRDTLLPKLISGEMRVNTRDEESEAVIGKYQ